MKRGAAAGLPVLVATGILSATAAQAAKVVPLPAGFKATDVRGVPGNRTFREEINKERREAGRKGDLVPGAGSRPAISTVRSLGSGTCRTSGIIPPLGVGAFGEPGIGGIPLCPAAPGQPSPLPPPPTPFEGAYYAWLYIIDLPSPTASTQPTIGITGLDTFLSIQGPQRMVVDVPALGYNVRFDITSVYDVDWGDPRPDGTSTGAAVTRNHPDQGGPYPDGSLRHQYIERGSATITITQRWSATWSAAGQGGNLPDSVHTTGTLTLPIQEIQAVVTG